MLQLRQMGVLQKDEAVSDHPALEALFKQIWADNGDAISRQYSGTGALKADFTRTGRRTKMGLLADGMNSLMRYYLNNFTDGARQDAMDLFYGHYSVRLDDDYYSPFIYHFEQSLLVAPLVMLVSVVLLVHFVVFSRGTLAFRFAASAGTVLTLLMAATIALQNGVHYVQYPRLRPPAASTIVRPWKKLLATPQKRLRETLWPSRKVHVI